MLKSIKSKLNNYHTKNWYKKQYKELDYLVRCDGEQHHMELAEMDYELVVAKQEVKRLNEQLQRWGGNVDVDRVHS